MIPDQFGCLGILKAFQKLETRLLPIVGWNFWFTENIFLRRDAKRDITAIQVGMKTLIQSKLPFWLFLYAEGSRFTKGKHSASEEMAKEKGYKHLDFHLQPRPTGFVEVVKSLRENKVFMINYKVKYFNKTILVLKNIFKLKYCIVNTV